MGTIARPVSGAIWPLQNLDTGRRRYTFGAGRGERRHAGVDLYAPKGEIVVATEPGVIVATQRFNGPRAHAILLQTARGPVILYGEVTPGSWNEFGVGIGTSVETGQPIARIGINPRGSQMLHFEMYHQGTRRNSKWFPGKYPPKLLDPTQYLKRARQNSLKLDKTGVIDPIKPVEPIEEDPVKKQKDLDEHDDHQVEDEGDDPTDPIDPIRPAGDDGSGIALMAVAALISFGIRGSR